MSVKSLCIFQRARDVDLFRDIVYRNNELDISRATLKVALTNKSFITLAIFGQIIIEDHPISSIRPQYCLPVRISFLPAQAAFGVYLCR